MEFAEYQFEYPAFALLLLLIPLGIWMTRRRRRGTLRFSSIEMFRSIRPGFRVRLRHIVPALRVLALSALILAVMRPRKGSELAPEISRGVGILILVDSSESMLTDDFEIAGKQVTRIEAVKKVAQDFIRGGNGLPGRSGDQIGLVSFAGYPVPRAPLTLDHGAVLEMLETIHVVERKKMAADQYGRPAFPEEFLTAVGDALALGADRLKEADVRSKVMVLVSDGRQTTGVLSPEQGAKIAESFGIKVYTIGIGQAGVILQTIRDPFFGTRKVPRRSDLDEDSLREIAELTGGKYFNAATTGALRNVYEEIDKEERSEIKTERFHRWDEKFQPLAFAALILIALEVALSQTLLRRIP